MPGSGEVRAADRSSDGQRVAINGLATFGDLIDVARKVRLNDTEIPHTGRA